MRWFLALAACAAPALPSPWVSDTPPESSTSGSRSSESSSPAEVMIDVRSPQDFPTVQRAYAGLPPDGTLHVRIAPGDYQQQSLILAPPQPVAAPRALRIEATGPTPGLRLDLTGREVVVSGVQIEGPLASGVAVKVSASERVELADLRLVGATQSAADQTAGSRPRNGLVEVSATGPTVELAVRGLRLVSDGVAGVPITLLSRPGKGFSAVDFADSVFVDAGDRPTLVAQVVGTVRLTGCLVVRGAGPLVQPTLTGARVRVEGSWVSAPEVEGLVVAPQAGGASPLQFLPGEVVGSTIYAGSDATFDPGVRLDPTVTRRDPLGWPTPEVLERLRERARAGAGVAELRAVALPAP